MELLPPLDKPTASSGLETVHRLLADSAAIIETGSLANPNDETHSIIFSRPLDAYELVEALSGPIEHFVGDFTPADVRNGLQKLLYPNSRLIRNAHLLGSHAAQTVLDQKADIKGLMAVIDHPEHHQMVPAKVHVLDPQLVELAAWDTIGGMKPSEIKRQAELFGIDYDHLRVWRLKAGNRHNRQASVAEMGLDGTSFVEDYIANNYSQKIKLPGAEPLYIPVEDLPPGSWARQPGYIELLKRLKPATEDELGDRWEALLRREDTPRHVVKAKLMWRTDVQNHTYKWLDMDAEYHRQQRSWQSAYQHFVYEPQMPQYNPFNHTVEHTSSLLGPVLLAGSVATGDLRQTFNLLCHGNHLSYWRKDRYPSPKMASALPPNAPVALSHGSLIR